MTTQAIIGKWASRDRWRIHALCILLLLLPIAIFAYSVGRVLRQQAEVHAASESAQIAHVGAALVQEDFEENTAFLQTIATSPSFRKAWKEGDESVVDSYLAEAQAQSPDFSFVAIFSPDGTLHAAYPAQPAILNQNFAFRDWYKGVTRQWMPYVSEVYQTSFSPNQLIIAIAVPVKEDGKPVGILMKSTDIIGKHFSHFYREEDVRSGKPQMELEVASRDGRFEDEGWRLRKDGSQFWANVIITAIRDQGGKLRGFAKVTRDVTDKMVAQKALQSEVEERREAEKQLHDSHKSLRQLSLHLLRTEDEERRRIGRELHDSLGQYLAVLKMKLDTLARLVERKGDEAAQDLSSQCVVLAQDSIRELRTVSYLLYPPMLEDLGLKSAIPWYIEGFSARSGIKTTFEARGDANRFPRDSELALFRVLQESLTNVHRHSGSKTAHVRLLTREGMGVLEIEDEGIGMPSQLLEQSGQDWMGAQGVGLRGMSERVMQLGGKLEVVSKENGTIVRASVPAEESASRG